MSPRALTSTFRQRVSTREQHVRVLHVQQGGGGACALDPASLASRLHAAGRVDCGSENGFLFCTRPCPTSGPTSKPTLTRMCSLESCCFSDKLQLCDSTHSRQAQQEGGVTVQEEGGHCWSSAASVVLGVRGCTAAGGGAGCGVSCGCCGSGSGIWTRRRSSKHRCFSLMLGAGTSWQGSCWRRAVPSTVCCTGTSR
jgi:hypothetical protein